MIVNIKSNSNKLCRRIVQTV